MNYLKKFESFQDHEEIHKICEHYEITNYTINSDESIDVDGDVDLSCKRLIKLPIKFNHISGYFDCSFNNLTTLEGIPKSVNGWFDCSENNLTTLEGAPQSVGNFICHKNNLTTLEGAPQYVNGLFDCTNNNLTTLEGSPQSLNDDFICSHNALTTLKGAPQSVSGDFFCAGNFLTTLEGAPQSVSGDFYCYENNQLKSLDYLSNDFNKEVIFHDTPVIEIYKLFDDYSISMIRILNDFKVVIDGKIDLEMLNALLYDYGKPEVEKVKGYELIES